VVAALLILVKVYLSFSKTTFKRTTYWGVQVFWYFVVGVWPVLYVLVYLS